MPVATLRRLQAGVQGTFGLLVLPGASAPLTTAEPPWKGNRRGVSCIPPGAYVCTWRRSPRFGAVFHVDDVPGRESILIHPGNLAGDAEVGLDTHTQGCILVGERYGMVRNSRGLMQRAVLVSRPAARTLAAVMGERPFILEVA
jgi:hypothetical protein